MNEVEVPEGSVFTYRLSNGTHVLVHQSNEQGKGTEELDCDEEVPLLFLEDGQITYNGTEVIICHYNLTFFNERYEWLALHGQMA
jgi:hypothetical protein